MLRKRSISGYSGNVSLESHFSPDPSSDDLSESVCACRLDFRPEGPFPLQVSTVVSHWNNYASEEEREPVYFELPPLYIIAEEIDFFLNLLKQL